MAAFLVEEVDMGESTSGTRDELGGLAKVERDIVESRSLDA